MITVRHMRHATVVLVMACMMAAMTPAQMVTVFTTSARVVFSGPSTAVGSKIRVNMKATSNSGPANAGVMLFYDSDMLGSVDNTSADEGVRTIRVHGGAGTPSMGTLTFTLNFNAIAAGTNKIKVIGQETYGSDSQTVMTNQQRSSTVAVGALQSASKDATLKSPQVSPENLAPASSPDADTYTATVGTDMDKVIVSTDCTGGNTTEMVSGNEGLQTGESHVTCRVTAQDDEIIKKYVIVMTKTEGGASVVDADVPSQVRMRVVKRVITILPPNPGVKVPEGFKESTINIGGHKVQNQVQGSEVEHRYRAVYGMDEAGERGFYRYGMRDDERAIQRHSEDPAINGFVTKEVYGRLTLTYDKIYDDYSLPKILLIVTVVIAVILLIILLVVLFTRGSGREGDSRDELGNRRDGPRGGRGGNRREERAEEPGLLGRSEGYQEHADEEGYRDSDWYDESQEYEDDPAYGDGENYRDLPEKDYLLDEENKDIYEEDEAVYGTEEEPQAELPMKKPAESERSIQIRSRTPAQASTSRQKTPVKQERPVVRKEAKQDSVKQNTQNDDFETFDL